jgi:hypothetical protein
MTDRTQRLLEHFSEHSAICTAFGSPFTAELCARMHEDLRAAGPIADLIGHWQTHPRTDQLAVRLCGALHAAALTARDSALAAQYPEQRKEWNMDEVWPLARAFLAREHEWVAKFISGPPQTNEVRRSIALLAGFLHFANAYAGPIELLELGASAGLNLNWDRFSYQTASWRWGDAASSVRIDTDWSGPVPPLQAAVKIRARAGCDLNPLDVRDPAQRLQLRSYIWADQLERLARFDAAAALAAESGGRVERADAAEWLAQRLQQRPNDAATLIYHSVFFQYPTRATRAAITANIEAAGARARPEAPLGWLRLEPEALLTGQTDSLRFLVELITWPGAERRVLAITDGHVRAVEARPI